MPTTLPVTFYLLGALVWAAWAFTEARGSERWAVLLAPVWPLWVLLAALLWWADDEDGW